MFIGWGGCENAPCVELCFWHIRYWALCLKNWVNPHSMFGVVSTCQIHPCRWHHHVGIWLHLWISLSFPSTIRTPLKPLCFTIVEWKVVNWLGHVQQVAFFSFFILWLFFVVEMSLLNQILYTPKDGL